MDNNIKKIALTAGACMLGMWLYNKIQEHK